MRGSDPRRMSGGATRNIQSIDAKPGIAAGHYLKHSELRGGWRAGSTPAQKQVKRLAVVGRPPHPVTGPSESSGLESVAPSGPTNREEEHI